MIDRRTFLAGTGAVLLAAPLAEAQQPGKVYRIGHLGNIPANTPETARIWAGFQLGLKELGWVEGRNLAIETRFSEGRIDRLPGLAAELVALKVDLITVSAGWAGVRAAKEATTTTPIVMLGITDPVAVGFVASLARPGGNITGIADLSTELVAKRLELLKQALPRVTRVANLLGPINEVAVWAVMKNEQETAARALGMTLRFVEVKNREDFGNATVAVIGERPDALLVSPHPLMFVLQTEIGHWVLQQRLPTISPSRGHANAGALLSYNADIATNFRRAATYVDKILKGAKRADLPVEQPSKFELVINLKTAKALGLTIPPSLLGRADEVIQ